MNEWGWGTSLASHDWSPFLSFLPLLHSSMIWVIVRMREEYILVWTFEDRERERWKEGDEERKREREKWRKRTQKTGKLEVRWIYITLKSAFEGRKKKVNESDLTSFEISSFSVPSSPSFLSSFHHHLFLLLFCCLCHLQYQIYLWHVENASEIQD